MDGVITHVEVENKMHFMWQIFYRVLREIPAGEELTVWYSNALAQWYDIPTTATPTHDEKGIV